MYFFVKNGPATKFFSLFGLENVSWFASTKYALAFLIIVYVWQQIGFYMVIFIGGLQEVPAELYEAAKVDGAGAWQRLTKITVPLIKNTTYLVFDFRYDQRFFRFFDQNRGAVKAGAAGFSVRRYQHYGYLPVPAVFQLYGYGIWKRAAVILFLIIFALSAVREFAGRRTV